MDVAAFVFGVLPIALYALDNYDRCLRPIKDYWKYESTLKLIRSHVFLQQQQLNATMDRLGLTNPTEEQLRARLQELYPDKCDEFMHILERMGEVLKGMMRDLDVDLTQYLEDGKPKGPDALSNRADWEWRRVKRSFSGKKRETLIGELQYWNSGLRIIVEAKPEIPFPEEQEPSVRKGVHARPTPQQCDNIRKDIGLVYEAFKEVGCACDCPEHRAMVRLGWHVGVTRTPAKVGLSFPELHSPKSWRLISVNIEKEQQATQADTKSVLPVPASPSPRLSPRLQPQKSPRLSPQPLSAKFKSKIKSAQIWSRQEKRPGGTEDEPAVVDESSKVAGLPSVPLVAPSTIPVPFPPQDISCLCGFINYAQDTEHGVIRLQREVGDLVLVKLLKGAAADAESEPAVLGSLLKGSKEQRSAIVELSRKHRLEIAAAASWAALYLCDTPWLGPDWGGKDDMQIFLKTEGPVHRSAAVRAVYPSISHVFRSESSSREPAEDDIPPPAAATSFQSGQIRNKALFTLGVLLLELALGKTFEHIRQKAGRQAGYGGGGPSPSEVPAAPLEDYEIATRFIDKVHLQEGTMYGNALARCLRCEFPGRDSTKNFHHQSFRNDFFRGVVEPLQTTFETCIA